MQFSSILTFTIALLAGHTMANPMPLENYAICCDRVTEYTPVCCTEYCLAIGKTGDKCDGNKCACK